MTTASSPKVLIVEDEEEWQRIWTRHLKREGAEVIVASSVEDGERLFEANADLTLVIIDGSVGGEKLNSASLIQKMRQTFPGPIVAASGSSIFRKQMMKIGCSHEAEKHMISMLVSKILKEL
ncbi:MAG: response regulator [bacterium]|nr:response regulator [bacterium]